MVAQWKLPWLHDYWGCCLSRWARVMTAKGEGLLCSLANWQLVTVACAVGAGIHSWKECSVKGLSIGCTGYDGICWARGSYCT